MSRSVTFRLLATLTSVLLAGCERTQSAGLSVESAWARPSPQAAPSSAFYMRIANQSPQEDVLQAVRADHCQAVEVHRSVLDEEGVMRMASVPGGALTISPGETINLEPGGLHLMCIGLAEPLATGQDLHITVDFEVAGSVPVTVEVREQAP